MTAADRRKAQMDRLREECDRRQAEKAGKPAAEACELEFAVDQPKPESEPLDWELNPR